MDMFNENVVLCASSAYEKKFYLNEAFDKLPEDIKNELKIMCVLFTEEVGGILTLEFDEISAFCCGLSMSHFHVFS